MARELTIFYSWQSDVEEKVCRNFIKDALDKAVRLVSEKGNIETKFIVDSDTKGVPGTPPITETILEKIRSCDIFAPDLTFVGSTEGGKLIPNPNVMGEYGFALCQVGYPWMMPIMNTAFGQPDKLPFDMKHLRHPICYDLPVDHDRSMRNEIRKGLVDEIAVALKLFARNTKRPLETDKNDPLILAKADGIITKRLQYISMDVPKPVFGPRFVLHFIPASSLSGEFELSPERVRKISPYLVPADFGNASIGGSEVGQWWKADPPKQHGEGNPDSDWFTRLFRNGVFEMVASIGRRIDDDPLISVKARWLENTIVSIVDQFGEAYMELGLSGPAIVSVSLMDLEDVEILGTRVGRFRRPFVGLGQAWLDSMQPPLGTNLRPLFDNLWMAVGWEDGSSSFGRGDWDGYREKPYRPLRLSR